MTIPPTRRLPPYLSPVALAGFTFGACLLATARLVRRSRFAGELTFAAESVNPPLTARDEALGASFGIALVGYLSR